MRHHPNRSVVSRRASGEFIPEAKHSPTPRRMPSRRSTPGRDSSLPFRPSARSRCGSAYLLPRLSALGCLTSLACAGPTMPSADFCGAVREDSSALSPLPGHPQISRGKLSYLRCIDAGFIKYAPAVDGGLCGRVPTRPERTTPRIRRVPRPAPSFHASFRPHLTVTPLRFPCPSAPRIPGRGTFTPKHDSMHGTHAALSAAARSAVRLHRLVKATSRAMQTCLAEIGAHGLRRGGQAVTRAHSGRIPVTVWQL